MKLKKHYIFFYSFIVFSGILTSNIALSIEELDIKFIPSCGKTRGGISVAEPPNKIYFCAQRINKIEWYFPNITEFFFIHEIMHLKHNTGDEKFVDCLAAKEFFQYKNGNKIIVYRKDFATQTTRSNLNDNDKKCAAVATKTKDNVARLSTYKTIGVTVFKHTRLQIAIKMMAELKSKFNETRIDGVEFFLTGSQALALHFGLTNSPKTDCDFFIRAPKEKPVTQH